MSLSVTEPKIKLERIVDQIRACKTSRGPGAGDPLFAPSGISSVIARDSHRMPGPVHDARRSFVSLSLADGARRDVLRWVTHGPEGDIVSLYTTLPWTTLCDEVSKLKLDLRTGQLLKLRKAANSGDDSGGSGGDLLQS